ncbi:amino acid adenylation domain-containing protein [Sphingomonas sp. PL-96]|uniref:amino acid adenylation domain-containing protein n=1 Tax=Sphingomonas sp. PL-96 TaxID=2887201 RepID=UPI001E410CA7|nr:amino acid adenylation domain-containing protein [Sphingomonas sp. PL-96]MCC2976613.1 amino acid adenylation domain-containing protein [Sphingomonas sp. PL-96]
MSTVTIEVEQDISHSTMIRIEQAVLSQCKRSPTHPAICIEDDVWTYAQLEGYINRISAAIRTRTDHPDPLIGVCLPRSNEMIGCLLGVMAAGGAYLPLDPDLPPARLALILEDAAPTLILGTAESLLALPYSGAAPLLLDDVPSIYAAPQADVSRNRSDQDLAYVIYTSGSTGKPKGVEVEHRSVVALVHAMASSPGFTADDTMLAVTRVTFDMSVLDWFLPLMLGGRLVIVPFDVASDPRRLGAAIAASRATVMQATPTTWRALLEAGWQGSADLRIWCGGEAMTRDLAERLLPRCAQLWNMFGPTETTVWSTGHRVEQLEATIPIGRALPGEGAHVLGVDLLPLKAGEIGELYLSGSGLARGYRGKPDLTSERFVELQGVGRAYRTGDLASIDEDGQLRHHGRCDDQVKVRGYRIELGDVESALSEHPAVAWCAVRCWDDALGENALFGYVVLREEKIDFELMAYLREQLPAYMVPQQIFRLNAMPLSPNGKIDRGALLHPSLMTTAPAALPKGNLDDLTRTERALAAIWNDLLPTFVTSRSDDFFDMGGYSLMTVRLLCHIQERFGADLALPDLLQHSSLKAMAALIDNHDGQSREVELFSLQPQGNGLPLIWLDAGFLMRGVHRQVDPRCPIYGLNISHAEEQRLLAASFDLTALAAVIVGHLERLVPTGPILLGGWCRWAIVAWEVAQQLRHAGRDMRLLVLLDAERPDLRKPLPIRSRLAQLVRRSAPAPQTSSFGDVVLARSQSYRPAPYDGEVALLLAGSRPGGASPDGGWAELVKGPLTILQSAGDHESMVRFPHSEALANNLSRALLPCALVEERRRHC